MGQNILDAFFISVALDSRDYKRGERDIRQSFKNVKDEAKGAFTDIEGRGKNASSSVRGLQRELAGLFLFLAGANSLKSFVGDLLTGAANADRLGQTIGMTASRISGWQVALKEVGGTAEDANGALQRMADLAWQFKMGGNLGTAGVVMRNMGIKPQDLLAGDPDQLLMKLAEARGKFSPQQYAQQLKLIGLPQNTIYLLEQGSKAVRKQVDEGERLANVNKADAEAAEKLQKKWAELEALIAGKVRPTVTALVDDLLVLVNTIGTSKSDDSVNGALIAMGAVAAVVGRPFIVLAAVIGLVAKNLAWLKQEWKSFDDWYNKMEKSTDPAFDWARKMIGAKTGAEADRDGTDIFGFSGRFPSGGGTAPPAAGGAPSGSVPPVEAAPTAPGGRGRALSGQSQSIMTSLLSYGIDPEIARGIVAGITAEGGSIGRAANGAYGIGQWRGPRQRALLAKYGPNPNLQQQVSFLVGELRGGDSGGPGVLRGSSAADAMVRYLRDFMRPQGRNNEHYIDLVRDIQRGYGALGMRGGGGVNIGSITVNTRATDAQGIARDIGHAIKSRSLVTQGATGITP